MKVKKCADILITKIMGLSILPIFANIKAVKDGEEGAQGKGGGEGIVIRPHEL